MSVYARDLLNGSRMGIDERRGCEPASLMKVWVLFHTLARMEADPTLSDRSSVYPGPDGMPSPDNLVDRPSEERMVPGVRFSASGCSHSFPRLRPRESGPFRPIP